MSDNDDAREKVLVELPPAFLDARGSIQPLPFASVNDVAIISSKRGAVRANHYHRTDSHHSYVLSGSLEYVYRPVGSTEPPTRKVIKAGELFFTPPMVEHAMVFLEDTVFLNLSNNNRDHDNYEADVVRIKLV
jgi:quercetin dioxygenase-like cupin family protein